LFQDEEIPLSLHCVCERRHGKRQNLRIPGGL
jgi:hypothetical protein